MRAAALALVPLLALAGCGGGGEKPAATPSADPTVNAQACRAFNSGIALLGKVLAENPPPPLLVVTVAPQAKERVSTAAQLAMGEMRAAMERTATLIQILHDAERGWTQQTADGFPDDEQVAAVKAQILTVSGLCSKAGVRMANAPR